MVDVVRLPINVEQGAVGGPGFRTTVIIAISGIEQRTSDWDSCRGHWDIGYGISGTSSLATVIALFRACMGRAFSFVFRDWSDFTATSEAFGTGDGAETEFQLIKTYSSINYVTSAVARSYVRNITKPIETTLVIKDNGSTVSTSDYTVSSTGLITFDTAPTTGHALTWTGEFDVPVRFDIDDLPVSMEMTDFGRIRGIRIVEVLE